MNIRLLEAIDRNQDGRLVWDFIVADDWSGIAGSLTQIRGATRRWRVITNPDLPVVVHDMDVPSRDSEQPRVMPEPELAEALEVRVGEELVRARLAHLLASTGCTNRKAAVA
jgi:hypothetical protein